MLRQFENGRHFVPAVMQTRRPLLFLDNTIIAGVVAVEFFSRRLLPCCSCFTHYRRVRLEVAVSLHVSPARLRFFFGLMIRPPFFGDDRCVELVARSQFSLLAALTELTPLAGAVELTRPVPSASSLHTLSIQR